MNKEESILRNYYSNMLYNKVLQEMIFYNKIFTGTTLLKDNNILGAKIGCVFNIILGIKEYLVEKKANVLYESQLYSEFLDKTVSDISKKTKEGYCIGSVYFANAAELFAKIRNKIAHGDYLILFDSNDIIFRVDEVPIRININKMINFVIKSLDNFILDRKSNMVERNVLQLKLPDKQMGKKIKTKSDLKNILKKCHTINFMLKSKNESVIPHQQVEYLDMGIMKYKNDCNISVLEKLKKIYEICGYEFEYTIKTVNDKKTIDKACTLIFNTVDLDDYSFEAQIKIIQTELQRLIIDKFNKFQPLVANFYSLLLLDVMDTKKASSIETIRQYITKDYNFIPVNYDLLGISSISVFNSLFSYGFDDIYADKNTKYENGIIDGFDYGKLNLEFIKPQLIHIDDTSLQEKQNNYKSLNEKIALLNDKYNNYENCLQNTKDDKAQNKIKELLKSLKIKQNELFTKKILLENELYLIQEKFKNNEKYYFNKAIIEGIRNAIAHGNYEIICETDYRSAKMLFKDIYENKLTFSTEVKIIDFIDMLESSGPIIYDYLKNYKPEKRSSNDYKIRRI